MVRFTAPKSLLNTMSEGKSLQAHVEGSIVRRIPDLVEVLQPCMDDASRPCRLLRRHHRCDCATCIHSACLLDPKSSIRQFKTCPCHRLRVSFVTDSGFAAIDCHCNDSDNPQH